MKETQHMSPKAKKILVSIGVIFGTVMVFLISFILTFSLIVNPIEFRPFSNSETIKENEELKEKVQTLNDEVELLNTTVEKYRAQQSAPPVPETVITPEESASQNTTSSQTEAAPNSGPQDSDESTSDGEDFSPNTVTSTNENTPEDNEDPVTIIDISE